jgi:hypothetical protein
MRLPAALTRIEGACHRFALAFGHFRHVSLTHEPRCVSDDAKRQLEVLPWLQHDLYRGRRFARAAPR